MGRIKPQRCDIKGRAGGRLAGGLLLVALPIAGCGPPRTPYPVALNSERPDERILAVRHAAEVGDRSAIPLLVDRLEDEDEAVRFFAIQALERLTGERLGYRYQDSGTERWRAVQRWHRYLSASRPAEGGAEEGPGL